MTPVSSPSASKHPYAAHLNPEVFGQHLVKIASNVCFGFFVVTVLTFTVIAVTYQPGDPWLQSSKSFAQLMTVARNATFQPDDTVITTAEDILPPSSRSSSSSGTAGLPPAINGSWVDKETALAMRDSSCDLYGPINCSAPGALLAIEKYNLQTFRSLEFYAYRNPVRGSKDDECDVAWKYRASKDGSPRMYRDFRRYVLSYKDNCEYRVQKMGDWHSGLNARPARRIPRKAPSPNAPAPPTPSDAVAEERGVDVIDDRLPTASEEAFGRGRYLYYERGADYCKGMSQYMWSLLCAMGEARYLNRTFVMDLDVCLPGVNNFGRKDEPGKDFRFYFDFEHLKENLPVIDQAQFLKDWSSWDSQHDKSRKLSVREIEYRTTPMEVRGDEATVLKRVFRDPEPSNNFWFRVCEGPAEKVIQRPWDLVWKSRRINDIVLAICGRMGWDFDTVHVVRGEKVKNKELWPNLDADTQPDAIARKLDDMVILGRNLYIATNEEDEAFFEKLRGNWRVFRLDDFKEFWSEGSEWYKETKELNGGVPVEFDGYMRVELDSEVLYKARKRIETFNDLTKDCKNGVGAC